MPSALVPKRILLAVESAELAEPALMVVATLAGKSKAIVDLLHVWEPLPFTPPDAAFHQEGEARSYRHIATTQGERDLKKVAQRAAELGVSIGHQAVREGAPAQTVVEVAESLRAELIVLTAHQRHGAHRWLQGSVSRRVAQISARPVLVVPLGEAAARAPGLDPLGRRE